MKSKPISGARKLRTNSTDAERKLWSLLRDRQLLGHKFRRQHPIQKYVVDFACTEKGLVVELDGGQHLERKIEDDHRTKVLESEGYRVLRFWNQQVFLETEALLTVILKALEEK